MKLLIQEAAQQDILHEVEWYAGKARPEIARRFQAAIFQAIDAILAAPGAGPPKHLGNPRLAGLRTWSVAGFTQFRVYYLLDSDTLTVVRVLHGKRGIRTILDGDESASSDSTD